MGSQTLEIMRQGVWASLTGGWFYDPHQGVLCNVVHLYLWLYLLCSPFVAYLYFPDTWLTWCIYCSLTSLTIFMVKLINMALHRLYDRAQTMSEANLKNQFFKITKEIEGRGNESGIEMKVMQMTNDGGGGSGSRNSVEHAINEASEDNSITSMDVRNGVIDLKVDVHRKNSSESIELMFYAPSVVSGGGGSSTCQPDQQSIIGATSMTKSIRSASVAPTPVTIMPSIGSAHAAGCINVSPFVDSASTKYLTVYPEHADEIVDKSSYCASSNNATNSASVSGQRKHPHLVRKTEGFRRRHHHQQQRRRLERQSSLDASAAAAAVAAVEATMRNPSDSIATCAISSATTTTTTTATAAQRNETFLHSIQNAQTTSAAATSTAKSISATCKISPATTATTATTTNSSSICPSTAFASSSPTTTTTTATTTNAQRSATIAAPTATCDDAESNAATTTTTPMSKLTTTTTTATTIGSGTPRLNRLQRHRSSETHDERMRQQMRAGSAGDGGGFFMPIHTEQHHLHHRHHHHIQQLQQQQNQHQQRHESRGASSSGALTTLGGSSTGGSGGILNSDHDDDDDDVYNDVDDLNLGGSASGVAGHADAGAGRIRALPSWILGSSSDVYIEDDSCYTKSDLGIEQLTDSASSNRSAAAAFLLQQQQQLNSHYQHQQQYRSQMHNINSNNSSNNNNNNSNNRHQHHHLCHNKSPQPQHNHLQQQQQHQHHYRPHHYNNHHGTSNIRKDSNSTMSALQLPVAAPPSSSLSLSGGSKMTGSGSGSGGGIGGGGGGGGTQKRRRHSNANALFKGSSTNAATTAAAAAAATLAIASGQQSTVRRIKSAALEISCPRPSVSNLSPHPNSVEEINGQQQIKNPQSALLPPPSKCLVRNPHLNLCPKFGGSFGGGGMGGVGGVGCNSSSVGTVDSSDSSLNISASTMAIIEPVYPIAEQADEKASLDLDATGTSAAATTTTTRLRSSSSSCDLVIADLDEDHDDHDQHDRNDGKLKHDVDVDLMDDDHSAHIPNDDRNHDHDDDVDSFDDIPIRRRRKTIDCHHQDHHHHHHHSHHHHPAHGSAESDVGEILGDDDNDEFKDFDDNLEHILLDLQQTQNQLDVLKASYEEEQGQTTTVATEQQQQISHAIDSDENDDGEDRRVILMRQRHRGHSLDHNIHRQRRHRQHHDNHNDHNDDDDDDNMDDYYAVYDVDYDRNQSMVTSSNAGTNTSGATTTNTQTLRQRLHSTDSETDNNNGSRSPLLSGKTKKQHWIEICPPDARAAAAAAAASAADKAMQPEIVSVQRHKSAPVVSCSGILPHQQLYEIRAHRGGGMQKGEADSGCPSSDCEQISASSKDMLLGGIETLTDSKPPKDIEEGGDAGGAVGVKTLEGVSATIAGASATKNLGAIPKVVKYREIDETRGSGANTTSTINDGIGSQLHKRRSYKNNNNNNGRHSNNGGDKSVINSSSAASSAANATFRGASISKTASSSTRTSSTTSSRSISGDSFSADIHKMLWLMHGGAVDELGRPIAGIGTDGTPLAAHSNVVPSNMSSAHFQFYQDAIHALHPYPPMVNAAEGYGLCDRAYHRDKLRRGSKQISDPGNASAGGIDVGAAIGGIEWHLRRELFPNSSAWRSQDTATNHTPSAIGVVVASSHSLNARNNSGSHNNGNNNSSNVNNAPTLSIQGLINVMTDERSLSQGGRSSSSGGIIMGSTHHSASGIGAANSATANSSAAATAAAAILNVDGHHIENYCDYWRPACMLTAEKPVVPKSFYKYRFKCFGYEHEFKITMDRLELLALFDRDLHWFHIVLSVVLCGVVSYLGAIILQLGYYKDLFAFLFCAVIASAQYSLVKSVQPDAASPIHGFNKTVAYSRAIYFCLCGALLLLFEEMRRDYATSAMTTTTAQRSSALLIEPSSISMMNGVGGGGGGGSGGVGEQRVKRMVTAESMAGAAVSHTINAAEPNNSDEFIFFGISCSPAHLTDTMLHIMYVLMLCFPLIFSLGLFPQINTFLMYLLEQIDMHVFGGNAAGSLLGSFLCVLRSILGILILYGPLYAALVEGKGTQFIVFSIFCAMLIPLGYHLSRSASDFSHIWALIKNCIVSTYRDDDDDDDDDDEDGRGGGGGGGDVGDNDNDDNDDDDDVEHEDEELSAATTNTSSATSGQKLTTTSSKGNSKHARRRTRTKRTPTANVTTNSASNEHIEMSSMEKLSTPTTAAAKFTNLERKRSKSKASSLGGSNQTLAKTVMTSNSKGMTASNSLASLGGVSRVAAENAIGLGETHAVSEDASTAGDVKNLYAVNEQIPEEQREHHNSDAADKVSVIGGSTSSVISRASSSASEASASHTTNAADISTLTAGDCAPTTDGVEDPANAAVTNDNNDDADGNVDKDDDGGGDDDTDDTNSPDPLPKKLQNTVNTRLKNDFVVTSFLALIIFGLHCSTVFTVLQPDLNIILYGFTAALGFLLHYIIPQMRKHMPWLCFARPILRQKEYGQFEVSNAPKVMWFEKVYIYLCMIERNVLFPLLAISALTADAQIIANKYGVPWGTLIVAVCALKFIRNAYSDPTNQYLIIMFTVFFFRFDYSMASETFLIDYFFVSLAFRKCCDFLLKLQFIVTYIAPWQITWGSAFHAFAQPFSVPHSAMLFLQAAISAILSTPLNPFLGSAIFLTSYVRPIKFWERDYNTRRIDHSNTRLSSQLERDLGSDDNNLNSIFYEHLTRSLQHSLCGDLIMGRWGNVNQGDCFVLASDYLNCLVHIIELGNGLCTFQMRGLEFRGTYCQQREVEAITEDVEDNDGCCCCDPGHLPRMLSINAMFSTRWLAWQVVAAQYVLEGYSISDNLASASLQVFEYRKVLITYYVKSIIYYVLKNTKLDQWLAPGPIQDALQYTLCRQFIDLDPTFNYTLDEDYDFRACGISRYSFCNAYLHWISFCYDKRVAAQNTPKAGTTTTTQAPSRANEAKRSAATTSSTVNATQVTISTTSGGEAAATTNITTATTTLPTTTTTTTTSTTQQHQLRSRPQKSATISGSASSASTNHSTEHMAASHSFANISRQTSESVPGLLSNAGGSYASYLASANAANQSDNVRTYSSQLRNSRSLTKTTQVTANTTATTNTATDGTPAEKSGTKDKPLSVGRDSELVSLCMGLTLLARRALTTASHSSLTGVEFFLHGLHALFKGDFRITSPRDEWVFADMELLHSVAAPAVKMALKLQQDHISNPDEFLDPSTLYDAIETCSKDLVISHEADPIWRSAVLRGAPNLLAFRHVMEDGTDEYRIIRLAKRFLSFRVIKLNRECVRGLWAGQQQELIYLRNRNPERGSIQNAKQALRNIINSSCDQPIGYPIYVSPLTTSYADTNEQLREVIGGAITPDSIKSNVLQWWHRIRERCRQGCSSGSAMETSNLGMMVGGPASSAGGESGELTPAYISPPLYNTLTAGNFFGGLRSSNVSNIGGSLSAQYGSDGLTAMRSNIAAMPLKPTSTTLLAGLLNREREQEREREREALREGRATSGGCVTAVGIRKSQTSSAQSNTSMNARSNDRERRATLPIASTSIAAATATGAGGTADTGAGISSKDTGGANAMTNVSGEPFSQQLIEKNNTATGSYFTDLQSGSSPRYAKISSSSGSLGIASIITTPGDYPRKSKGPICLTAAAAAIAAEKNPNQTLTTRREPSIELFKKVIIVDDKEIYDCLDLGRRIDIVWPNEEMRSNGGRMSWKDWLPRAGMVGFIVHYWVPNHENPRYRSHINRIIYLIEIGDHYVPVGEYGLREYNQIIDDSSLENVAISHQQMRRISRQCFDIEELLQRQHLQQQHRDGGEGLTPILGSSVESPTSQLANTATNTGVQLPMNYEDEWTVIVASADGEESVAKSDAKAKIKAVSSSSSEDEIGLMNLEMQRRELLLNMWKLIAEQKADNNTQRSNSSIEETNHENVDNDGGVDDENKTKVMAEMTEENTVSIESNAEGIVLESPSSKVDEFQDKPEQLNAQISRQYDDDGTAISATIPTTVHDSDNTTGEEEHQQQQLAEYEVDEMLEVLSVDHKDVTASAEDIETIPTVVQSANNESTHSDSYNIPDDTSSTNVGLPTTTTTINMDDAETSRTTPTTTTITIIQSKEQIDDSEV